MYIPAEARRRHYKKAIKTILESEGELEPEPFNEVSAQQEVASELKPLGSQRFFKPSEVEDKTWKEVFKDLEWRCEVEVTAEAHDKMATLTTLTTILRELAAMGDIENARTVLNKLLEETGVFTPMELVTTMTAAPVPSEITPEGLPPSTTPQTTTQAPLTQT